MSKCVYTLSENKAPFPRVAYNCECGFESVEMNGYIEDKHGNPSDIKRWPSGKCMKCQREIQFNPPSEEKKESPKTIDNKSSPKCPFCNSDNIEIFQYSCKECGCDFCCPVTSGD
jgi:hypothetical protein